MTETILYICGIVAALGGAYAVIKTTILEPLKQINKRLDKIDQLEDGQKILMKSTASMLQHTITGNHIDKLSEDYEELINFCIDK